MATLQELAIIVRAQISDFQQGMADSEKAFSKLSKTADAETKALDARFRLAETSTAGYATSLTGLGEKHLLLTEKLKLATTSTDALRQQYDILAQKPGVTAEALAKMSVRVDEAAIKQEKLRQELEKIDSPMKRFGIAAGEVGDKLTSWGSKLSTTVTLPIVAAGTAILALTVKMAGAADELETMSKQTGLNVESLQELRYVASQTNTKFDAITMAVATMTRNMVASDEEGSKMAAAFETIGVQVKNLDGSFRDMNDVFPETLKALADMPPGVERNNLLMQIFGTRAKELIPLLDAGASGIDAFTAKAHELGLVAPDTNKALANFNDKMAEVKLVFAAAFAELAAKFLPILQDKLVPLITGKIVPVIMDFADWLGGLIDKFMALSPGTQGFILQALALFAALGPVLTVIGTITKGAGLLSTALSFLAANPVTLVIAGVALLVLGIVKLIQHWDSVKAAGIRAWEGIKPYIQPVIDLVTWCSDAIQDVIKWFGSLFGIKKGSLAANVAEVTENVDNLTDALVGESLVPAMMILGSVSDNVVTPAVKRITAALQTAADVTKSAETALSGLDLKIDVVKAQYDLLTARLDPAKDATVLLTAKLDEEKTELGLVQERIAVLRPAYEQMKVLKGENAEETQKLYLQLLQEETAQANLGVTIKATTADYEKQLAQLELLRAGRYAEAGIPLTTAEEKAETALMERARTMAGQIEKKYGYAAGTEFVADILRKHPEIMGYHEVTQYLPYFGFSEFQAGGWLTRPTLLTDVLTGVPYGIAAEHGREAIVPEASVAGTAAGDTYNVTLNVRADEIDEVQKVIGVFKGLKQTARAMGVAVT